MPELRCLSQTTNQHYTVYVKLNHLHMQGCTFDCNQHEAQSRKTKEKLLGVPTGASVYRGSLGWHKAWESDGSCLHQQELHISPFICHHDMLIALCWLEMEQVYKGFKCKGAWAACTRAHSFLLERHGLSDLAICEHLGLLRMLCILKVQ